MKNEGVCWKVLCCDSVDVSDKTDALQQEALELEWEQREYRVGSVNPREMTDCKREKLAERRWHKYGRVIRWLTLAVGGRTVGISMNENNLHCYAQRRVVVDRRRRSHTNCRSRSSLLSTSMSDK